MSTSFLNMDDETQESTDSSLGSSLKRKKKEPRPRADTFAVAEVAKANGFDRTTTKQGEISGAIRRGRPPLNDDMTYWRIYINRELRARLNEIRDTEGRRLNDVLEDMLNAYVNKKLDETN